MVVAGPWSLQEWVQIFSFDRPGSRPIGGKKQEAKLEYETVERQITSLETRTLTENDASSQVRLRLKQQELRDLAESGPHT
ncbi:hypothetical protein NDU88_002056 [Pleurodeles waltl]|uniref:Uncharacterized protein n=1 Tax=Pleurodeles waltl TaxID=8319 RepID=A0AAV7UX82_PLEWA|nr:hypothetical protein NDU88_002056 [Pleurodeles waltl]